MQRAFELEKFLKPENLVRSNYYSDTYRARFGVDGQVGVWDITYIRVPFTPEKEQKLMERFGIRSEELSAFYDEFLRCVKNDLNISRFINAALNEGGEQEAVSLRRSCVMYVHENGRLRDDKVREIVRVSRPYKNLWDAGYLNSDGTMRLSKIMEIQIRTLQVIRQLNLLGVHIGAIDLDSLLVAEGGAPERPTLAFGSFMYAYRDDTEQLKKYPACVPKNIFPGLLESKELAPTYDTDLFSWSALSCALMSGGYWDTMPDLSVYPDYMPEQLMDITWSGFGFEAEKNLQPINKEYNRYWRAMRKDPALEKNVPVALTPVETPASPSSSTLNPTGNDAEAASPTVEETEAMQAPASLSSLTPLPVSDDARADIHTETPAAEEVKTTLNAHAVIQPATSPEKEADAMQAPASPSAPAQKVFCNDASLQQGSPVGEEPQAASLSPAPQNCDAHEDDHAAVATEEEKVTQAPASPPTQEPSYQDAVEQPAVEEENSVSELPVSPLTELSPDTMMPDMASESETSEPISEGKPEDRKLPTEEEQDKAVYDEPECPTSAVEDPQSKLCAEVPEDMPEHPLAPRCEDDVMHQGWCGNEKPPYAKEEEEVTFYPVSLEETESQADAVSEPPQEVGKRLDKEASFEIVDLDEEPDAVPEDPMEVPETLSAQSKADEAYEPEPPYEMHDDMENPVFAEAQPADEQHDASPSMGAATEKSTVGSKDLPCKDKPSVSEKVPFTLDPMVEVTAKSISMYHLPFMAYCPEEEDLRGAFIQEVLRVMGEGYTVVGDGLMRTFLYVGVEGHSVPAPSCEMHEDKEVRPYEEKSCEEVPEDNAEADERCSETGEAYAADVPQDPSVDEIMASCEDMSEVDTGVAADPDARATLTQGTEAFAAERCEVSPSPAKVELSTEDLAGKEPADAQYADAEEGESFDAGGTAQEDTAYTPQENEMTMPISEVVVEPENVPDAVCGAKQETTEPAVDPGDVSAAEYSDILNEKPAPKAADELDTLPAEKLDAKPARVAPVAEITNDADPAVVPAKAEPDAEPIPVPVPVPSVEPATKPTVAANTAEQVNDTGSEPVSEAVAEPDAEAADEEQSVTEGEAGTEGEAAHPTGWDPFAFVAPGTGDIEIPPFEAPEEMVENVEETVANKDPFAYIDEDSFFCFTKVDLQ